MQAERGVAISASAWKLAVSHAKGQVILAEKKVERQRHAHDIRYAKLMVSVLAIVRVSTPPYFFLFFTKLSQKTKPCNTKSAKLKYACNATIVS